MDDAMRRRHGGRPAQGEIMNGDNWFGFVFGLILMGLLWAAISYAAEADKVRDGYLTFYGKRYSVVLYDTLDKPEKP